MQRCLINPDCFVQGEYTLWTYIKMPNVIFKPNADSIDILFIKIIFKTISTQAEFKNNSLVDTLVLLNLRPLHLSNYFHIYLIYVNEVWGRLPIYMHQHAWRPRLTLARLKKAYKQMNALETSVHHLGKSNAVCNKEQRIVASLLLIYNEPYVLWMGLTYGYYIMIINKAFY